jgi:hypothetical protein
MVLYTSDGCSYSGMDEATVINLRLELGRSTIFVDKATHDAYVIAHAVRLGE